MKLKNARLTQEQIDWLIGLLEGYSPLEADDDTADVIIAQLRRATLPPHILGARKKKVEKVSRTA